MDCPNPRFIRIECSHGRECWLRVPCRRRWCEWCKKQKKRRYMGRLMERFCEQCCAFLTVTFRRNIGTKEAHRKLASLIKMLRKTSPGMEYAKFPEYQKRGVLHFHLILFGFRYFHWKRLRAAWQKRTGAHQIDIRRIRGAARTIGYVAKYVTKALDGRVSFSRGLEDWFCRHQYEAGKVRRGRRRSRFKDIEKECFPAGGFPVVGDYDGWYLLGPRPRDAPDCTCFDFLDNSRV